MGECKIQKRISSASDYENVLLEINLRGIKYKIHVKRSILDGDDLDELKEACEEIRRYEDELLAKHGLDAGSSIFAQHLDGRYINALINKMLDFGTDQPNKEFFEKIGFYEPVVREKLILMAGMMVGANGSIHLITEGQGAQDAFVSNIVKRVVEYEEENTSYKIEYRREFKKTTRQCERGSHFEMVEEAIEFLIPELRTKMQKTKKTAEILEKQDFHRLEQEVAERVGQAGEFEARHAYNIIGLFLNLSTGMGANNANVLPINPVME